MKIIKYLLIVCCLSLAPGITHADKLSSAMMADIGKIRPKNCPRRWCACYLNKKLESVGKTPLRSFKARDFVHYGKRASRNNGVIMVMRSHVGVVIGTCTNGKVRLVSGNHSRRVGVGCYNPRAAIAWRLP